MVRMLLLAVAALALSACARGEHATGGLAAQSAAQSASLLLSAAAKGDRVAFEDQIDREAVREDLRRQIVAMGEKAGVAVDGGPSDFALDRMISPDVVRLVRPGDHKRVNKAPDEAQVAKLIKPIGRRKACLTDDGHDCLMTFAQADGRWRLVGMQAATLEIPVAQAHD